MSDFPEHVFYKGEWTFIPTPQPVGWWVLYAEAQQRTMFAMYHKPTDDQIKNTEQLLGWTWKDMEVKHD